MNYRLTSTYQDRRFFRFSVLAAVDFDNGRNFQVLAGWQKLLQILRPLYTPDTSMPPHKYPLISFRYQHHLSDIRLRLSTTTLFSCFQMSKIRLVHRLPEQVEVSLPHPMQLYTPWPSNNTIFANGPRRINKKCILFCSPLPCMFRSCDFTFHCLWDPQ